MINIQMNIPKMHPVFIYEKSTTLLSQQPHHIVLSFSLKQIGECHGYNNLVRQRNGSNHSSV